MTVKLVCTEPSAAGRWPYLEDMDGSNKKPRSMGQIKNASLSGSKEEHKQVYSEMFIRRIKSKNQYSDVDTGRDIKRIKIAYDYTGGSRSNEQLTVFVDGTVQHRRHQWPCCTVRSQSGWRTCSPVLSGLADVLVKEKRKSHNPWEDDTPLSTGR